MKKTKADLIEQKRLLNNLADAAFAVMENGIDIKILEDNEDGWIIEYIDYETKTHLGELNYCRTIRDITGGQIIMQQALDSDIYPPEDCYNENHK